MEVSSAIALIDLIRYKPDWKFSAIEHTNFEGTVSVRIDYPAPDSLRELASDGYTEPRNPFATFPVPVGNIKEEIELFRCILDQILKVETHEAREFFRIEPTKWAPFHPHKLDGQARWGTPELDLLFGIV